MTDAWTSETMSPGLQKVAERAYWEPATRFYSLAYLIDVERLRGAYGHLRANAAVGVDGVTKEAYGQALEDNLQDLHGRLRAQQYRHQPIRRVHLPKEKGGTRPIGISTTEDKVVQTALRQVLEAIWEQDFLDCSYGFRPGRSPHDAVRALTRAVDAGEANWILEIDVVSFFDSLCRTQLLEMLQKRVADGSLLRLVSKCLHVGVLDGEEYSTPDEGTAQGSTLSPLLGNIYLHYALDLWFTQEILPHLRGKAGLVRYADDAVFGFEQQADAEEVLAALGPRLAGFGLRLHPDKTRLLDFRRPSRSQVGGKGPATYDFLGFTWHYRRTRGGHWRVACKTRRARLARAVKAVHDWCRCHRHEPIAVQHATLMRRLQGHYDYYGVNGNCASLRRLDHQARRAWHKWLNRRSQRARLRWERFLDLLRDFPLPTPRIVVQIWR